MGRALEVESASLLNLYVVENVRRVCAARAAWSNRMGAEQLMAVNERAFVASQGEATKTQLSVQRRQSLQHESSAILHVHVLKNYMQAPLQMRCWTLVVQSHVRYARALRRSKRLELHDFL